MKAVFGGLVTIIILGVVIFVAIHFGWLNLGRGSGDGTRGDEDVLQIETVVEEISTTPDAVEEITITIVVTQDKYLFDEQEVTLTQIKEKVLYETVVVKVILEDNYASVKAWDDIKTSFTEWGITPVEQ